MKLLLDGIANLDCTDNVNRVADNIDARNSHKQTPLYYAVSNQHFSIVGTLIAAGARINTLDNEKKTPIFAILHQIIYKSEVGIRSYNVMKCLLQAGKI